MTLTELRKQVTKGVKITKQGYFYYADYVAKNGDENRLTQSKDIEQVASYLKNHGLLK